MSTAPDETVLQSRVPPAAAGQTLAAWLSARFRYLDLDGWRAEIDAGRVQRNGGPARSGDVLRARDVVAYRPVHREPHADLRVELLHDEASFAVVHKPAHLVSHADGAFVQNTFFRVLERHYRGLGAAPKLRLVHRLDRETSGLMVVAKTAAAATALQQQFTAGAVAKEYLAIVHGVIAATEFTEDGAIARAPASEIAIRRAVVPADHPGAQAARTRFAVERRLREHTLVRAFPATGRTHQIRVHLTHRGHPLVGDKLYGRSDAEYLDYVRFVKAGGDPWWDGRLEAGRQFLHAASLRFAHPETGVAVAFAAPLPDDMAQFLRDRG